MRTMVFMTWMVFVLGLTGYAQEHKLNYQEPARVKIEVPESSSPDQIDSFRLLNQDVLNYLKEHQVVESNFRTNQMLIEKDVVYSRNFLRWMFAILAGGAGLGGLLWWRSRRLAQRVVQTSPFPRRTPQELPNNVIYVLPREQAFYEGQPTVTPYQEALPVEHLVKK